MKLQILATAALLTATISLASPIKAEMPLQSTHLKNLPAATDLESSTYDPYPFGTVEHLELRTNNGGVNCLGSVQLDQDSKAICTSPAKPSKYVTTPLANLADRFSR